MAALTTQRNTLEYHTGGIFYLYEFEAAGTIYAGSLVCLNSSGKVVPASDTASLVTLGRAENTASPGEMVKVKKGVFVYENGSSAETLAVTDIGRECYILDDQTVGKTGGTNKIKAGKVLDVTTDGVVVII